MKADDFEREGQGRHYIDNSRGVRFLEDEGNTPSEQPHWSGFSLSP